MAGATFPRMKFTEVGNGTTCSGCNRTFKSNGGRKNHQGRCQAYQDKANAEWWASHPEDLAEWQANQD